MTEAQLKKKLEAIFSNNKYYFSSYTGTPMFMQDKAMPVLLRLIKQYAQEYAKLRKKRAKMKAKTIYAKGTNIARRIILIKAIE